MTVFQNVQQQILQELKTAVGKGFAPSLDDLSVPPDPSMGDVAFGCFLLAKKLSQNPADIAREIAAKIAPKNYVSSVKAVGPYVNFFLAEATFGTEVVEQIHKEGEEFGQSSVGEDKRVMVEYANLNSHKDVHIGHLRNMFVGQMAVRSLVANGYDVVPVAYINDLGTHVAKSVWGIQTLHEGEEPEEELRMDFLRNVYVEATAKVEEDPSAKEQVSEVFRELESGKGATVALWKKTRKWSLDYLRGVYDELGLELDAWYFESDLIGKTRSIIDRLIKDGLVVESEGAWIVDLEEEKLGVNLLIKSDGTLLYNAKDLALAQQKEDDFYPVRSVYVIDNRQSHAMKQLFATLKRTGFDRELVHLSYDFVTLSGGAMSARKGNVVRYETLRDRMFRQASKETRVRHEDWSDEQVSKVARAITFAALRFGMLKQDKDKRIVFDIDEALSFEGFTGPYLLYTFARIQSLLKKATVKSVAAADRLVDPREHVLLHALSQYPNQVFALSETFEFSQMAQYLFDLAKKYSEFYNMVSILGAEDEVLVAQRLGLSEAVARVLQNGLTLMGIEVVEAM